MKYYVTRTDKRTGEKQYMKTKCVGGWLRIKEGCWQFSKQGAKGIAKRYGEYTSPEFTNYEYAIEAVA